MAVSAGFFILLFRMRMRILVEPQSHANETGLLHYLVLWKFDFLPVGVMLALCDLSFPGRAAKYLCGRGPAFTAYLLILPCAVIALCETPLLPHGRFMTGIGYPFAMFCFGLLVLSAGNQCAFPRSHGRVYRFLEYLGNRSYTYYVFHLTAMVVAWVIIYRWIPWGLKGHLQYAVAQVAVVAVLLAPFVEVVYRYVELPLTRFGKNLVDGRRSKPASAIPRMENQILPLPIRC
jgi:peptidoglycan/LPS O-acetylase OafA/YrhL